MNPQAFILILVLAGSVIGAGGLIIRGQINARVQAETELVAQSVRAELAERQVDQLREQVDEERERQEELELALQAARDRENVATEVLEDRDRLDRLTQAKPGLLERQAQKATTQVWETLESESRD